MGRNQSIDVVRHLSVHDLDDMILRYESKADADKVDERVLRNLRFVQLRYSGMSVADSSDNLGISRKTGYNIQTAWNSDGPEGIVPRFSRGPEPRLTDDDIDRIESYLSSHPMDASMLRRYLRDNYGQDFSEKHIRNMFMGRGLKYSKELEHLIDGATGTDEPGAGPR